MTTNAADPRAIHAIDDYVRKTRGWEKDSYDIELYRRDANTLVFSVGYKLDEAALQGSTVVGNVGESFSVDVDAKSLRVVRELANQ